MGGYLGREGHQLAIRATVQRRGSARATSGQDGPPRSHLPHFDDRIYTYLAAPSHISAVAQFKASIVNCNATTALQMHLAFRSPGVTQRPYMLWSFPGTWTLRNSSLCFSISCLPALSVFARSEILFLIIAAVVTATVVAPAIGIYSSNDQGVLTP